MDKLTNPDQTDQAQSEGTRKHVLELRRIDGALLRQVEAATPWTPERLIEAFLSMRPVIDNAGIVDVYLHTQIISADLGEHHESIEHARNTESLTSTAERKEAASAATGGEGGLARDPSRDPRQLTGQREQVLGEA